jgi:hypothetical protein
MDRAPSSVLACSKKVLNLLYLSKKIFSEKAGLTSTLLVAFYPRSTRAFSAIHFLGGSEKYFDRLGLVSGRFTRVVTHEITGDFTVRYLLAFSG